MRSSFAARWALTPRQGASLAHAKWPLSMEGVCGQKAVFCHEKTVAMTLAAPAREDLREGVETGPPKTGAREATRTSEVGRIDRAGDNIPALGRRTPNLRGECGPLKRREAS